MNLLLTVSSNFLSELDWPSIFVSFNVSLIVGIALAYAKSKFDFREKIRQEAHSDEKERLRKMIHQWNSLVENRSIKHPKVLSMPVYIEGLEPYIAKRTRKLLNQKVQETKDALTPILQEIENLSEKKEAVQVHLKSFEVWHPCDDEEFLGFGVYEVEDKEGYEKAQENHERDILNPLADCRARERELNLLAKNYFAEQIQQEVQRLKKQWKIFDKP